MNEGNLKYVMYRVVGKGTTFMELFFHNLEEVRYKNNYMKGSYYELEAKNCALEKTIEQSKLMKKTCQCDGKCTDCNCKDES